MQLYLFIYFYIKGKRVIELDTSTNTCIVEKKCFNTFPGSSLTIPTFLELCSSLPLPNKKTMLQHFLSYLP